MLIGRESALKFFCYAVTPLSFDYSSVEKQEEVTMNFEASSRLSPFPPL